MFRNNKRTLLLTSLVLLLPMLAGILLWDRLPEYMTTHWGADGHADDVGSRVFAVFGLPLTLLAAQCLMVLLTSLDRKNRAQDRKIVALILWVLPIVSLFTSSITYADAFGIRLPPQLLGCGFTGLLFLLLGNYMPKCRPNHTIGVRIAWTLASEANWNVTHRFTGKLWVAGGVFLLLGALLPPHWLSWWLPAVMIAMIVLPLLYSWWFHRRELQRGTLTQTDRPANKRRTAAGIAITAAVLLLCFFSCFTGNITFDCGETALAIRADYYADLTVEYDAVDAVSYLEDFRAGMRTNGYGSPRLSMGSFQNDIFGGYTLYSYTGADAVVVLTVGERTLVLGCQDSAATRALYETLLTHCTK